VEKSSVVFNSEGAGLLYRPAFLRLCYSKYPLGLRAMCDGCRESDTEIIPLKKDTELFFFHCMPYTEYYLFSSFLLSVLPC
jgi:hypothetical protein